MTSVERKQKKGRILMGIGVLLILAALFLAGHNILQTRKAAEASKKVLTQMESMGIGDYEGNPDAYEQYPDLDMPTIVIDDASYIGILEIPVLDLRLPVMESWSYEQLETAPCRYDGSAYQGDLIIAGHNYDTHFGKLKLLGAGDAVVFTDVDGNTFNYQVAESEIVDENGTVQMYAGDWELTLFTCTYDGGERVTVRCIENQ